MVFVIWLAACIYRIWAIRAYNYRWGDGGEAGGAIAVESYIRRTWIGPVIATLFVIVAPLTWFFA